MVKRASRITSDSDCKVCGNLHEPENLNPCDRCHEPVCMNCAVTQGPDDKLEWLCSASCEGTSPNKVG